MLKPYGCHSKPRSEGYWARQTYHPKDKQIAPERGWGWVIDTMSQECQYRKSTPDPRCEGCKCP